MSVLRGTIPYRSRSHNLGGFVEELAPSCFAASLSRGGHYGDVIARQEHDSRMLLGRRSVGTLRLYDGADALRYEIDLPDTTAGRDIAVSVGRGDLANTSFVFSVMDDADDQWDIVNDALVRTVKRAEISEVSPVSQPAYPGSALSLRSEAEEANELERLRAAFER